MTTELDQLNTQLTEGDLLSRTDAAETLAGQKSAIDTDWIITIYDKLWVPIATAGDDVLELSGTDPRNNLPTATLRLKGDSPLIGVMMDCNHTMVGVTVETAGLRFAYYVDTFDFEFDNDQWIGVANLLGIWDVLNYLVIWAEWFMPIQAQVPFSHAIFCWATCTVIENMIAENALRIQLGLWEFINNAIGFPPTPDIRAWFGALLQSNGKLKEMLKCPIYVVRTNPLLDTSPFCIRTVRFETCATVIRDITRSTGVDVRVDLWLPGDEQPDEWTQRFDFLALDQPTYVVTVKDRSQITGPTHTVLDSVFRQVIDIGGSFFGEVGELIEQVPGMDGIFYSPRLGQHFTPPWAVLVAPMVPGEVGNVVSCKINSHTPRGWQHIIGGRSPKWLTDLQNAFYAWIIDSISILFGFSGIPSNLLEGFMSNTILAFELHELYSRRNAVGPYHPCIEVMHPTESPPYSLETFFAFINAYWDSRGWVSATAVLRSGEVFTLGKDIFRSGLVSIIYPAPAAENATGPTVIRKRLYTDYIENVTFRVTEDTRDLMLQIGDGKAKEAPLAKHQRNLTGLFEALNVLTLYPQSTGLL